MANKKLEIGEYVVVDSFLVHHDNYRYAYIRKGKDYEVLEIGYSKMGKPKLIYIRDNNGVGIWVDLVFFRVT